LFILWIDKIESLTSQLDEGVNWNDETYGVCFQSNSYYLSIFIFIPDDRQWSSNLLDQSLEYYSQLGEIKSLASQLYEVVNWDSWLNTSLYIGLTHCNYKRKAIQQCFTQQCFT